MSICWLTTSSRLVAVKCVGSWRSQLPVSTSLKLLRLQPRGHHSQQVKSTRNSQPTTHNSQFTACQLAFNLQPAARGGPLWSSVSSGSTHTQVLCCELSLSRTPTGDRNRENPPLSILSLAMDARRSSGLSLGRLKGSGEASRGAAS